MLEKTSKEDGRIKRPELNQDSATPNAVMAVRIMPTRSWPALVIPLAAEGRGAAAASPESIAG